MKYSCPQFLCITAAIICLFGFPQPLAAQETGQPLFSAAAPSGAEEAGNPLSTHQAAVECATAIIIEQHKRFANARDAAFKAGLCAGKIQSYMLRAQEEQPSCFPAISLEEGINIFVKWADTHLSEGDSPYPQGIRKAFEGAVPCLKNR